MHNQKQKQNENTKRKQTINENSFCRIGKSSIFICIISIHLNSCNTLLINQKTQKNKIMKTLEITLYSFDELNDKAKDKAINNYLHYADNSYIYDEAINTINKFCDVFNVSTRHNYFNFQINADTNIMNLTGLRLRKYILNNFSYVLFKPKYIKSLKEDKKRVYHTRIKTETYKNDNINNVYYSAINTEISYNLTGFCYDFYILQPIYDFIEYKAAKKHNYNFMDYEDLISECFHNLEKALQREEEYLTSEEYISEIFEENEYLFKEDGTIYRK